MFGIRRKRLNDAEIDAENAMLCQVLMEWEVPCHNSVGFDRAEYRTWLITQLRFLIPIEEKKKQAVCNELDKEIVDGHIKQLEKIIDYLRENIQTEKINHRKTTRELVKKLRRLKEENALLKNDKVQVVIFKE